MSSLVYLISCLIPYWIKSYSKLYGLNAFTAYRRTTCVTALVSSSRCTTATRIILYYSHSWLQGLLKILKSLLRVCQVKNLHQESHHEISYILWYIYLFLMLLKVMLSVKKDEIFVKITNQPFMVLSMSIERGHFYYKWLFFLINILLK